MAAITCAILVHHASTAGTVFVMSNSGNAWGQGQGGGNPPPAWGQQGYPSAPPLPTYVPYGPSAPPGMYMSPVSGLALPPGVTLASSGRRIGAYFLAIPLSIVTLFIGYIIWGVIVWSRGQTPALQVLGMRCWRPETGRVAGWWWMALREVIGRLVDGILSIITLVISFVFMLSRPDHRTLHDMVAGTVVVYDPSGVLNGR